jgi:hypothetical protein
MHPAMQKAFGLLYGFTSDKEGIRHALIDKDAAPWTATTRSSC